jgi:hypothetical protein
MQEIPQRRNEGQRRLTIIKSIFDICHIFIKEIEGSSKYVLSEQIMLQMYPKEDDLHKKYSALFNTHLAIENVLDEFVHLVVKDESPILFQLIETSREALREALHEVLNRSIVEVSKNRSKNNNQSIYNCIKDNKDIHSSWLRELHAFTNYIIPFRGVRMIRSLKRNRF